MSRLFTPDGLSGFLAFTRDRFGDTMGYDLTVYPDYAAMDRNDPQNTHLEKE